MMQNPGFQNLPMIPIVGAVPPHIQLQQAQEAFMLQQQQQQQLDLELEPNNPLPVLEENNQNLDDLLAAANPQINAGNAPENPGFQIDQLDPAAGDANNNDQPEDANNNTTDPALQQLQQQQQLIIQQQQHQVNQENGVSNANNVSENVSTAIIENGTDGKDKKDKRKKKKKKKKNRLVTVIGADGSFRKELPVGEAVNGEKKAGDGVDGDENDEPEEAVEIE